MTETREAQIRLFEYDSGSDATSVPVHGKVTGSPCYVSTVIPL